MLIFHIKNTSEKRGLKKVTGYGAQEMLNSLIRY